MNQRDRVRSVLLKAESPMALYEIRRTILAVFKHMDSEAAISARIREIRHEVAREGLMLISYRAGPGRAYHLYAIIQQQQ